MNSLYLILLVPLFSACIMFFMPKNFKYLNLLHVVLAFLTSATLLYNVCLVLENGTLYAYHDNLFLDSLGAIFITLIAITGFLVNVYSTTYMKWEQESGHINEKTKKNYFALSFIFIFTMALSCICNNLAFLWTAVEATTLSSVFLVAVTKDKKATESGYKYIVLCSIGLAFALFATVLLYSANHSVLLDSKDSILFTSIIQNAKNIDSTALKLIFVFALIGYGAKAGFVPTHTWLPDVHAEGPAPTSAMLSGILLKCALLALVRFYAIVGNGVGFEFVQDVMIVSGVATLFLSAFFLITQHNVKRMFAYHSIAHMGVIAFALGVGGLGVLAALFHSLAHSFTKALAFCTTGNIARIYGTKNMNKMGSMIKVAPLTAVLFGISICSLVGVPGFAIFVSEFLTFKAAAVTGQYALMIIFAIALSIIFIADFSHFFMSSFGKVEGKVQPNRHISLKENLPLIALAVLMVAFGVWQFESFWTLLENATNIIFNKGV